MNEIPLKRSSTEEWNILELKIDTVFLALPEGNKFRPFYDVYKVIKRSNRSVYLEQTTPQRIILRHWVIPGKFEREYRLIEILEGGYEEYGEIKVTRHD